MKSSQPQNIDLDNPEFRQVETLLNFTSSSVFMTGKAGTGKSTFLKYITANTKKRFVVLAPTGIAAVNAGGQTIHSFFHLPLKPLMPDDPEFAPDRLAKRMKYTKKFIKLLRDLELIIIDEISMVRADVIDFIDKILRHYCRNSMRPFGGKQLLMVGDAFQLEPVVTAQAREILRHVYNNFYFFSARAFQDFELVPIELRKVYRQSDSEFITMLDRIRAGRPTAADLNAINTRVNRDAIDPAQMTMTIATRREIVDYINETHLAELKTDPVTYEAVITDIFPDSSFPTDRQLTLKEGAQVVFIRNDPERRWVNGTIGRVRSLSAKELRIELEDGKTYAVEPEVWENVEYGYDEAEKRVTETVKGTFRQFPVRLAWALTIHKSQGLTFRNVIIDVGAGAFTGGQSYVALSRCTSLEGITMASPIRPSDIYVSPSVLGFAATFNDPRRVTDALELARADALYADASKALAAGDIPGAIDRFAEAVKLRNELASPKVRRLLSVKLHALAAPRREAESLRLRMERQQQKLDRLAEEFADLGFQCLDEGWDHEPAVSNFNKALSLNPGCYMAKVGLGRAWIQAGEHDAAIDILARASREYERYEAQYELGSFYLSTGDLENALRMLRKAQKTAPDVPEIHDALADTYEAFDNHAQAERHRARAAKLRAQKAQKAQKNPRTRKSED